MRSDFRLRTNLAWRNISDQPIIAFEVVLAYFDPFNRRISVGGTWLITGKNSGNWGPLQPGESASDGTIGFGTQPVLTAFAYVRAVRQANGNVWNFQPRTVEQEIRKLLPNIRDIGNLDPEPERPASR